MSWYPAGEPGVVDLGARHFLRPLHNLVRTDEPLGVPVRPRADAEAVGLAWWHDCPEQEGFWFPVAAPIEDDLLRCPVCGDSGRVRDGRWEVA